MSMEELSESMKRKAKELPGITQKSIKRARKSATAGKAKEDVPWPEYFHSLFKVFKAINTVLAFVSSRKQLATTFPVVRSSVEALLKQPLELKSVAELKSTRFIPANTALIVFGNRALLPDQVIFSYIPKNELLINATPEGGRRERSPNFSTFSTCSHSRDQPSGNAEEHVLVLEFAENSRGKKSIKAGLRYNSPPSLTPAALKKLVERRNEAFRRAINELILATPAADDPVTLLQAAGRDHVPANLRLHAELPALSSAASRQTIPEPNERPEIHSVLEEIQEQQWYSDQIIERRVFEAKDGQTATMEPPLSDAVAQALRDSCRISTLYTHQVAAIQAIDQGKNVVISTSTASGKSVIYQVPVLRFLEDDPSATAIFVYPTKALAQDQKAALEQLLCCCPGLGHIKVATYDGDTPQELRAGVRLSASVIFTNFDMIHTSILPHEDLWRSFMRNLKLLAVDELHYYSGLLGSHVAQVMRRFRRVCAAVGNRSTLFVSCSATISNPRGHMQNVFGLEPTSINVVTEDGAPSGRKDFIVWNPPLLYATDPSLGRRSSLSEATKLMIFLMKRGIRTILFCKTRKACELAMKTIRADLSSEGRFDILGRTQPYRGGYSQEDRRRIEHDAFTGHLLGVIATNALELGVDIGVLDAVIMLGFPHGIASFRQQAGRAGRRSRDCLTVFVADSLPIDQHYVNNPGELFEGTLEDPIIDLESKVILEAHLQCAANEMPLSSDDHQYFGPMMQELCETRLSKDADGWYYTHPKFLPFPSKHVSIRGTQEEKYAVVDITKVAQGGTALILEEIEASRAMFETYEGGVFMHQGLTFIVKEVSHDMKLAKVVSADVNWITSPRDLTNVDPVQTHRIKEIRRSNHQAFYGRVGVEVRVFGFFKIRNRSILDSVDVDTPPWEHETTGMWIDIPKSILDLMRMAGINAAEAIHAAQHAFLNQFSLVQDVRTECKAAEKEYRTMESQRKRPARLIFYDAIGKCGGVTAKAFDNVHDILTKGYDVIEACECEEGCLKCVQSVACREGNTVCSKIGAGLILGELLGLEMKPDWLPAQPQVHLGLNTVVEASIVPHIYGIQIE